MQPIQPRRLQDNSTAQGTPDLAGMDLQQILAALQAQSQGNPGVSDAAGEGNSLLRKQALQQLTQRRLPIDPATAFNGGIAGV